MNEQRIEQTKLALRSPRAAAIAGIIFSILFGTAIIIIRLASQDSMDKLGWLESQSKNVIFALNLIPYAGIAFLWFVGVVRDNLGEREDRLFSTVFYGSSLLFLAMLFESAAVAGGSLASLANESNQTIDMTVYNFSRNVINQTLYVYAMRMAAVFMFSLGTIWHRTRTMPRWLAFLTFILALILLFSLSQISWIGMIFPSWVLIISIYILVLNMRRQ